MNVIALDRVALLGGLHLAGEQPDVADVMLRTGVMASGEMNVDRHIERNAVLAPARDVLGMPLGVRGGKLAADIARASNEPGADRGGADRQAQRLDLRLRRRNVLRAHARDDQVLPNSEADITVAEIAGDLREAAHLIGGPLADRWDDPDPTAVGRLPRMHADERRGTQGRPPRTRIARVPRRR